MPPVEELSEVSEEDLAMLSKVLHDVVHAGASVSFVLPFAVEEARAFWTGKVMPSMAAGTRRLFVARVKGQIMGTVQLDTGMPPNQQHRAEVLKLLVHPDARRQGVARALMAALEETARLTGKTLLTLDTRTGDRGEPLYLSLGYLVAGVIPRYARGPQSPELEGTTLMYKELQF